MRGGRGSINGLKAFEYQFLGVPTYIRRVKFTGGV